MNLVAKAPAWVPVPRLLALALSPFALVGCAPDTGGGGGGGGVEYRLHLTPFAPANQSPFEGLTDAELEIAPAVGEPSLYALPLAESGNSSQIEGLSAFEEAVLTVRGYDSGGVVSWGRTLPLTMQDGDELEATLLVSLVDKVGWLGSLEDGLVGGGLVALGDGRFALLGGVVVSDRGARGQDTVQALDVGAPGAALAFGDVATLPAWREGANQDGDEHTERSFFTPALLTTGPYAGQYLVSGGCARQPNEHPSEITPSTFAWDPATGQSTVLDLALRAGGRADYTLVVDQRGSVVIHGGWGGTASDRQVLGQASYDIVNAEQSSVEEVRGVSIVGVLGQAGVAVGSDGSLFCGGALVGDADEDNVVDWYSTSTCERVTLDGEVEEGSPLPSARAGLAMVTLADGSVLATGGANQRSPAGNTEFPAAEDDAYLRSAGSGEWVSLSAHLALPRAGHEMALLPDGRVLIVGGSASYNALVPAADPYACAEIFDPVELSFTLVDDCDAESDAASLEEPANMPMMAVDPAFGALVVGGMSGSTSASPRVGLFVPGE